MKNNRKKTNKKNSISILATLILIALAFLNSKNLQAQSSVIAVDHFDKVVVSPHISVVFKQGNTESVVIETTQVPDYKINAEVKGNTLWIYLEGAKTVTKSEKYYKNGQKRTRSIYNGTQVTATVTYKELKELSLRGEERFVCESPIITEKFRLQIYGESQIYLDEVAIETLHATIYGESYLEIKAGTIARQKFTSYGESKINTLGVANRSTKVTAYGEGSFRFNVSEDLKVTAYGEATVTYQGNPEVRKGLVIGEATIRKISQ